MKPSARRMSLSPPSAPAHKLDPFPYRIDWLTALAEANPVRRAPTYPIRKPAHLVTFFCHAPAARSVCLAGDFNRWHRTTAPMKHMPDGEWALQLALPHGHQRYYFLVDGRSTLDPTAVGTTRNWRDELVSIVAVS
jgi:1,4-alpha-glucan branching enzyme